MDEGDAEFVGEAAALGEVACLGGVPWDEDDGFVGRLFRQGGGRDVDA